MRKLWQSGRWISTQNSGPIHTHSQIAAGLKNSLHALNSSPNFTPEISSVEIFLGIRCLSMVSKTPQRCNNVLLAFSLADDPATLARQFTRADKLCGGWLEFAARPATTRETSGLWRAMTVF
jgi:hypothetical protein